MMAKTRKSRTRAWLRADCWERIVACAGALGFFSRTTSRDLVSVTNCSYSGIKEKYAAVVRSRKNKLCNTISFGRTVRLPKTRPTDSRFLLDKNFYSSCRTAAVMVEILLVPARSTQG